MLIRHTHGNVPPRLTHCPYCGDRLSMGACPSCAARDLDNPDGLDGPIDAHKPFCYQDPCRDPACRMDHGTRQAVIERAAKETAKEYVASLAELNKAQDAFRAIEGREKKLAEDLAAAKMKEESTSIESARVVTVRHRGPGKTTAMLHEAELRDNKRRTLMIKAAEDAIARSIIDHKYFSRIVSLDQRMPREAAILIVQAIIDGKIPAVSMSFL